MRAGFGGKRQLYVVLEAVRQHEFEDGKFKLGENADCNSCWNRSAGMVMKGNANWRERELFLVQELVRRHHEHVFDLEGNANFSSCWNQWCAGTGARA